MLALAKMSGIDWRNEGREGAWSGGRGEPEIAASQGLAGALTRSHSHARSY